MKFAIFYMQDRTSYTKLVWPVCHTALTCLQNLHGMSFMDGPTAWGGDVLQDRLFLKQEIYSQMKTSLWRVEDGKFPVKLQNNCERILPKRKQDIFHRWINIWIRTPYPGEPCVFSEIFELINYFFRLGYSARLITILKLGYQVHIPFCAVMHFN